MPFQKGSKGGRVTWIPPADEEVQALQERIESPPDTQFLSKNIEAEISRALGEVAAKNPAEDFRKLTKAGPVDIVIPVHGGLHIVKDCLNKLVERTDYPFNLIIVNDKSDDYVTKWLQNWHDNLGYMEGTVNLIHNEANIGFAASCNRGAKAGKAPFVCFLNSDVIVTPGWLTKVVRACLSDDRIAIVNPCTNNTALINLPMRPGMSYLDMNNMLEKRQPTYPVIMPTGFCYFVRRKVLDQIGYFDEAFVSYGEESDHWMRTLKCIDPDTGEFPQYKAVLADDTFVFHERGSSFSIFDDERWMQKRKKGASRFHTLHPDYKRMWRMEEDTTERLKGLRETEVAGFRDELRTKKKYNIAWIVHSVAHCGGMKVIADTVNELQERGVNAVVVQVCRPNTGPDKPLDTLRSAPIVYGDKKTCVERFATDVFDEGIVVAGTGELAEIVLSVCDENPKLQPLNHLQAWDIGQVGDDQRMKKRIAKRWLRFPHTITCAEWLKKNLERMGVKNIECSQPGVDNYMFYPRKRKGDPRPTFLFYLNSEYPFKGGSRGIAVAKELIKLAKEQNLDIRVIGIGIVRALDCPELICYPEMAQTRLAKFIGEEVDVVIDPSYLHSYGLPCLEAIAMEKPFAAWDNGGVKEYAIESDVVIRADDKDYVAVAQRILSLAKPDSLFVPRRIRSRSQGVDEFIKHLERMFNFGSTGTKIVMVTPHTRKFGGPTTLVTTANILAARGYDVTLLSVYQDSINLELTGMCRVPLIYGLEHMPKCDVVLVPSDSDKHEEIKKMGRAKKRILFKLSQNERFKVLEEQGLNGEYDAVLTSTEWLKRVTEKGQKGWTYTTQPATRVGWFNHEFKTFASPPTSRIYHKYGGSQVVIGGLIHRHPLKGSNDVMNIFTHLNQKHGKLVKLIGVGETQAVNRTNWFQYFLKPSRRTFAELLGQTDIWLNCSYTEGLGRLSLEAMSSGCVVVASDTGCEYMENGANCLTFPIGDKEAAVKCIETLLNDEGLFTKLALNGYKTAEAYADPTQYGDNLVEAIEEVLK